MTNLTDFDTVVLAALAQCKEEGHVCACTHSLGGVDFLECNCCGHQVCDPKIVWFRRPATDPVPTTDPERA